MGVSLKATIAALLMFMLALTGSAQKADEYYISVSYNTNLRAAPSIRSPRVDLVVASQVLVVVGEVGDWLKIDRLGAEMYMANWVPYRRVGGGTQVSTQFADLSCENGPQWIQRENFPKGGYWLFTQGHRSCKVTVRSPLSEMPAEAFVDFGREVSVEGSAEIVDQVNKALDWLMEKEPEWNAFVSNAVNKIIGYEPDSKYDTVSGDAYVHPHLKIMFISRYAAFGSSGPPVQQLATVLVHEACHVYQVETGMKLAGDEYEIMCHALELDMIDALDASPSLKRLVEGALKGYLFFESF